MPQARTSLFKPVATVQAAPPETFVLVVDSYDLKATPPVVKGFRLDSKEEVSVALREEPGINKGEFKRPEIKDFARVRKFMNEPSVTPGGAMLIEGAVKATDDSYTARWISVLSHEEGESEVLICTAHYEGVKMGRPKQRDGKTIPGRPNGRLTILFDGDGSHLTDEMAEKLSYRAPFTVATVAELRNEILKLFDQDLGVGVRLRLGGVDGPFDAQSLKRSIDKDVAPEDTVDAFIAKRLPGDLDVQLAAGTAMLEVIPHRVLFMGPATLATAYKGLAAERAAVAAGKKPGKIMAKAARYCSEIRDARGYPKTVKHFGKSVVQLRLSSPDEAGERGLNFITVIPLFARDEYVIDVENAVAYAQTANFAPAVQYARPAQAADSALHDDLDSAEPSAEAAEESGPEVAVAEVAVAAPVAVVPAAVEPTTSSAASAALDERLNRGARRFQSGKRPSPR